MRLESKRKTNDNGVPNLGTPPFFYRKLCYHAAGTPAHRTEGKGQHMRHLTSVEDLRQQDLEEIFRRAAGFRRLGCELRPRRKFMANLFYQPSTRTRLSFAFAAERLGWSVVDTENAKEFSSDIKGETLADTIRVVAGYCDVIVLRHDDTGAARLAASVSRVPVINAAEGKGDGEHPTQALLDLFTIRDRFHGRRNLTVTFVGDLKRGRTVRSLALLLSRFRDSEFGFASRMQFVAPRGYEVDTTVIRAAETAGITAVCSEELEERLLRCSDVVYMTRSQSEHDRGLEQSRSLASAYTLSYESACMLPERAVILHPLPRNSELPEAVGEHPGAIFFEQAHNGMWVRMGILDYITEGR